MSHQTLPVKPFGEVYQALLQRETSDFCTFEPKRWRLRKSSGKFYVHVRAHQWSVLTAAHARTAVSGWPNNTIAKDFGGCFLGLKRVQIDRTALRSLCWVLTSIHDRYIS